MGIKITRHHRARIHANWSILLVSCICFNFHFVIAICNASTWNPFIISMAKHEPREQKKKIDISSQPEAENIHQMHVGWQGLSFACVFLKCWLVPQDRFFAHPLKRVERFSHKTNDNLHPSRQSFFFQFLNNYDIQGCKIPSEKIIFNPQPKRMNR